MKTELFDIPDLVLFTPSLYEDNRGSLSETFRQSVFEEAVGSPYDFVQDNQSLSNHAGTVRGLHCQAPPSSQGKLVRCVQGSVVDVAVDFRPQSVFFGQYVKVELSAQNRQQLWVPPGFLHGFMTLEDNTIINYKCTNYYDPATSMSVLWNDPSLNIDWPLPADQTTVSDADKNAPHWKKVSSPF